MTQNTSGHELKVATVSNNSGTYAGVSECFRCGEDDAWKLLQISELKEGIVRTNVCEWCFAALVDGDSR